LIESLGLADLVVLADVFKSEAIPERERLHPAQVVAGLRGLGVPAVLRADADAIVEELVPRLLPGDVVAILSNGGFGGIYEKLPKAISEAGASADVVGAAGMRTSAIAGEAPGTAGTKVEQAEETSKHALVA
jgi:UDP-N-acetylmuramate: L-alanyl-gamma-D-glutamyl-meso-diaminopimelate ligase